jgi:hypothetical protein
MAREIKPAKEELTRLQSDQGKAAGGGLTAKQTPYRPGTAPAPGLRAQRAVVILRRPHP